MKISTPLSKEPILPLNLRTCACGQLMDPLVPLEQNPDLIRDLSIYSHRGFIKGISILSKVKKLKYGYSTRRFGNMAFKYGETEEVVSNRKGFMKAVGVNIKNSVFMRPNHGKAIEIVDSSHKGRGAYAAGTSVGPADAMITFEKGVALGLNSADCVPLIMTTKTADVLALVHAGRVGTDARIAKTTIRKIASYGIKPADLIVGIGPAIQKSCYKLEYLETTNPNQWLPWVRAVNKAVKIKVEKVTETSKEYSVMAEKGNILVDIIGFNIQQLLEMGVKEENIEVAPVCALCQARRGEIFSHYLSSQYQKTKLFPEGRFMSIAQLS
jgi:YfiH family protein